VKKFIKLFYLIGLLYSANVFAQQTYPSRNIQMIMPLQAGSGVDILMRPIVQRMGENLNQAIVIENIPGGAGLIGATKVAQSPSEGYVLGAFNDSILTMVPNLYPKVEYDPITSFVPISQVASITFVMVANPSFSANTAADLVRIAKANPGKLSYASAGIGSGQHVLPAALWHLAGTDLVHVPYRGAQAAYLDLLGGRVDLFFDLSSTARVHVNAGSVKALAVSGAERNPMHPDVPTILESGVAPLDLESWFGYFVPKKTPQDVQDRLRSELAKVIAQADLQDNFRKAGGKPLTLNADQTRALVRRDVERWTKLVRDIGIKAE
jgi:tripartite-type tricarboxylate transporter receptor subunit TctC